MIAKGDGAPVAPAVEDAPMREEFFTVPLGKGCVLALTPAEYVRAFRRGKWLRRREAARKREANRLSV